VVELARRAISAVDDVVDAARGHQDELVGDVRIGVIPTMAPYLLPAVVEELRRRHPRSSPVLVEERTEPLVGRLRSGTLDIGLLASPVPAPDLSWAHLADDPFRLAMPEEHPLAGRGPLRIRHHRPAPAPSQPLPRGGAVLAAHGSPRRAVRALRRGPGRTDAAAVLAGGLEPRR
jgi:DNA-binding transcriptional LysR family regulator